MCIVYHKVNKFQTKTDLFVLKLVCDYMKKNKIIYALIIFLLGNLILGIILDNLVDSDQTILYTIGRIITQLIILICVYLINKKELHKMFLDFKINYRRYLKKAFLIWIVGFSFMIISALIINYFILDSATVSSNEEINRSIIESHLIFAVIYLCILAPMIEEIVFRLSFNGIKNKYIFIAVTSLLFAFLHVLPDLDNLRALFFFSYLAIGLVFSLSYLKTKNIFSSIIIHSWHNIVTLILLFIL